MEIEEAMGVLITLRKNAIRTADYTVSIILRPYLKCNWMMLNTAIRKHKLNKYYIRK